ncbi:hypothetical protein [Campylobacter sp. MG1]|uniref:hypothetical protein n=1 Tax=Campylobacter sp. MG1 TaxID=2976332 RepID=UPI00226D0BB5|nr:hypothetical protein [Campylobacter sp. MG1]
MIPSFLSVLFCIALLVGIIFNLFNNTIFIILLVFIFILNLLIFIAAVNRKRTTDKKIYILKEILKSIGITNSKNDLNEILKLVTDEIYKLKQKNNNSQNNNEFLHERLNEQARNLKNINQVLSYTNTENLDYTRELIEKYNDETIKNIYSLTKTTIQYETHYNNFINDLNFNFANVKVAVVNDNILENFLLENILKQYGMKVVFFSKISDFRDYACVVVDEKYDYNKENTIILSDNYNKSNIIRRPINKIKLKNILLEILKEHKIDMKENDLSNDMLIFLDSNVASEYLLNVAEKHAKLNKKVDSISSFKEELKNNYKIIAIGYNCISYDYETLKSNISHVKMKNPNTFIMLFLGNKHTNKNLDFVDLIVKDASETEIMEVIKKYI